ncbi:MAG: TIM barrel protein [Kiritimatiellae bacterium]|nr:TIM barrel protein [Kiritimatiellia bacterium]
MKRREFLGGCIAATLMPRLAAADAVKGEYHAFSRVFEFFKDMYKAADFLRSCGYDGVEWTVRPKGFVDPATATLADLRRAKAAADAAGLKADNIVVGFLRGDDPGAERLVMNAAEAGFKSFRGNYFRYDRSKTHRANMDAFKSGFDSLVALASKSGMKCCYQNHSTYNKSVPLFGSLVWDLASILADYDPKLVGVQYDPMHVRAEGGPSWDHTLGAIARWIDIVCLKDFYFALDASGRDWKRVLVPAGQGIVDFGEVKRLMALEGVAPRFTIHYDYKFPTDEAGARRFATDDLRHYRSIFG